MTPARAMIAAPQPEAAEAGADILRDGGNAVDAAVACALVQTVVDPIMCGLAGFGSMQIRMEGGPHLMLDFHGRAPQAVRPEMWQHLIRGESEDGFGFLLEGSVNEIGYQSITTPMTLKALSEALARFGTRPLEALLAPAIAYAREGFAVRPHVRAFWDEVPSGGRVAHREFVTRYPATAKIYAPGGEVPRIGERLRNPDMARTLERIAEHGPEDFYTGAIAAEIAADMERNGGLLSAADLAEVAPTETEPLWSSYRGHRLSTNRPPGGGLMLVLMLNILENFDLSAMGHNSAEYIATVSEAMKIATVEKDTRIGDPRFFDVPVEELASKAFAAEMAARIRRGEKTHVPRLNLGGEESKDTTHISVVDSAGNAVALTHSIGMPSGVVTDGLGFMYNGCMGVFDPRPGRAGSLAPGKSRFTAMCPTMLVDKAGPSFVIGAPGGTFITMGVLQGILNAVDFDMSALEAVSAPRFCTTSDTIDLTNRVLRRTERELQAMGYPTRRSAMSYGFAGVHALRRTAAGWDGGADPGRDGVAIPG
ncbi:gamma-glutamyltransferase [Paralimibaculum aggregatum]|uniref:Glutathione hydrolase proenzyme n=1 Tax=Paralimibaculum aggregatum TaxID=3036245 RepID=A0ABQ6LN56_9RHOB|nr:gamma-glutamyltransferase [Limibaculum sp. NKW23]GMG83720.1 gamma-glutamyltransferase [Limibaculum sp. NKW23]